MRADVHTWRGAHGESAHGESAHGESAHGENARGEHVHGKGARSTGDRGSGAGAVIVFALVFLSLSAFVIDGGLAISQRERAADIAEQAARYAAQDIDREALYENEGGDAPINAGTCDARVRAFAREMDLSASDTAATHCVSATPDQVEVEVRLTYEPVLTGLFFGGDLVVRGRAVAENLVG